MQWRCRIVFESPPENKAETQASLVVSASALCSVMASFHHPYLLERVQKVEDFYVPRPRSGDTFDRVFGCPSPSRKPSMEPARLASSEETRASSVERQQQRAGRVGIPVHNPAGFGRGSGRSRSAERTKSEVSVFTSTEPEQDLHQLVQKRHFEQTAQYPTNISAVLDSDGLRQRTPSPGAEGRTRMKRSSSVPSVGCMSARSSREYITLLHGGYQQEVYNAPFNEVQLKFKPETYSRQQRGAMEQRIKENREHIPVTKLLFSDQDYVPGKRQFYGTNGAELHKNLQDRLVPADYKQRLMLKTAQCNARRRQSSGTSTPEPCMSRRQSSGTSTPEPCMSRRQSSGTATPEPCSVLDRSNGLLEKLVGARQNFRRGLTPSGRSARPEVRSGGARCGEGASAPCSARRGSSGGYATARLWRP